MLSGSGLYTVVRQFSDGFIYPGLGTQGKLYISVGHCLPAKFPDASQGPTLPARLSKGSSLRPAMLYLFYTDRFISLFTILNNATLTFVCISWLTYVDISVR